MYLDASPITPFTVAWLGFFGIGIGILLILEAGAAAARGAHFRRVEREGRIGAWSCLAGIVLLVVAGAWTVLS